MCACSRDFEGIHWNFRQAVHKVRHDRMIRLPVMDKGWPPCKLMLLTRQAAESRSIVTGPRTISTLETTREMLATWLEAVAQDRSRAAFSQLFSYFAPRLKGYLLKLGADGATAEEVVQDVMLTVWRKAHLFDRRQASPSTWLFTVARNRWIDMLRKDRNQNLDPHDPYFAPGSELAPDESLLAGQEEERVHEAMKTLPPEQAELVQLAFFTGQSHREIADGTGIPLGTVKSRLRLAFTRLRQALDGKL